MSVSLLLATGTLTSNENKSGLNIDKSKVNKIIISAIPKRFETMTITNRKHISSILDYLCSIRPIVSNDSSKYAGGGYSIKTIFKDNNERIFLHYGNMFLIERDKFKYEIPYTQAIKIDCIIASILEDNFEAAGKSSISGIVERIQKEASGRNKSCVIVSQNNSLFNVNLEHASIIDSTGTGWLILHDNDKVRIFYDGKNKIKMDTLSATTVFIKKTAQ